MLDDDPAQPHDGPTPRVTIGMPVWNTETTLRETLDSVLAQEFTDFELVVSDNASTDSTPEILAEYAARDPRVRVVRQPENIGGPANFSGLVALARGAYFKWQSGDDVILPGYVARCVEVLDADPGVVLAYCKTVMVGEDGSFWRNHDDRLHLPQPEAWRRLHDFARYRWLCNPQFGVIRTDVLRQTGLLQPKVSADVTMLAELALRGRFHEVPERLFRRRIAASSVGLGEMGARDVARWFNPSARRAAVTPDLRVFLDINRAVLRAPLSPLQKLMTLAAYDYARARRQYGILRYRRRLRRSGQAAVTWQSLRESPTA